MTTPTPSEFDDTSPALARAQYELAQRPDLQRKAARRLAALVEPALGVLAREMVTAEKSSDRQRAANSILDRAGVPRTTQQLQDPDLGRALLLDRLLALRDAAILEGTVEEDATTAPALDEVYDQIRAGDYDQDI